MKKLIAAFWAFCAISFSAQAQSGYKIGATVADFKLKNVDGKQVSLSSAADKGAIVVFTCNHCPFAKAYEDRIIDIHNQFSAMGYPVIAINPNDPEQAPDDSYEKMQARAQEKNYPFPYLFDETQATAKKFGAVRTPHVFVVKKDNKGKFVLVYAGGIDDNWENAKAVKMRYLTDALNDLSENLAVHTPETKAVGCTIKWKK